MSKRAVILAHGDLDGMVSAILLLKRLPENTPVIIANVRTLNRELRRLAEASARPQEVYVADIPLDGSTVNQVESCARRLRDLGVRIHVYDHHLSSNAARARERLAGYCATFVVDARRTTAAALVWKHFLGAPPDARRWLELLSKKSDSNDPSIREHFGILAALMQPRHWKMTPATLRALACDASLTDEQKGLADWYYEEHLPRARHLAESAEILTTLRGRKLAWLDLRAERDSFFLAKLAAEIHGVSLAAHAIHNGVVLGAESIDQGLDLSALHGEHERAGIQFSVAGHKSPVKFSPGGGETTDSFVAVVKEFILAEL